MEFRRYMHIERLGRDEVSGILDGTCYIYPKIDGTNSVVWLEDGEIHAGSRKRELSLGDDNGGFYASIKDDVNIKKYLEKHPSHYLYGEWLIRLSIKYYDNNGWAKFYIFDVYDVDNERYLSYEEYEPLLKEYQLLYIPLMAKLENPNMNDLTALVKSNHYLINDESKIGEGIVIKNYNYQNRYGRTTFAKIVAEEFFSAKKENHVRKKDPVDSNALCQAIADTFLTNTMINKEYEKIAEELDLEHNEVRRDKVIGMLLNRVWHEFLVEETPEFIKKYKLPVVDFKCLRKEVDNRVKEVKKSLFS